MLYVVLFTDLPRFPDALPSAWSLANWLRRLDGLAGPTTTTLAVGVRATAIALALVVGCLENESRSRRPAGPSALWLLYLPLLVPQVAFLFGAQVDCAEALAVAAQPLEVGFDVGHRRQLGAGLDLGQVPVPGLGVHGHHHVHPAAPALVAGLGDADLVPGGQALDVRREDVARADRHAHAQDRLGEQLVGRRGAGAVDVGELDDEIVDRFQRRVRLRRGCGRHAASWVLALRQPGPA